MLFGAPMFCRHRQRRRVFHHEKVVAGQGELVTTPSRRVISLVIQRLGIWSIRPSLNKLVITYNLHPATVPMDTPLRSDAESVGEMLPGWKCITSLLVLLSYSAMVMMWLPRTDLHTTAQAPKPFNLSDEELLHQLNVSSTLFTFSRSCETFLLEASHPGGRKEEATEAEKISIQGWSGGEWHYSPESDFEWNQQQKILGDGSVGDHEATFSVQQTTRHDLFGWSLKPLKLPIHPVEGLLVLRNFWDWVLSMDSESESDTKADFNRMLTMQNLKIFLQGAFVDTDIGRRLCMTGCAYRNDHSFTIDCGFILKMTCPSGHTLTSAQQIQAELSSSKTQASDLLHFLAFRIDVGPNLVVESESHSKQAFLQPAMNKNVNNKDRVSGQGFVFGEEFLEDYGDP